MTLQNRSGSAHRLRVVALSTSLGLLGTAATAQDINLGDAIRGGIGAQIQSDQRGNVNPTQRGVGEAVRGALQGDNAGDALRRGVGEAARTAGETPQQTLRRDQFQSGQAQGRYRYDAQGRQVFDAQGRPLYDTRVQGTQSQRYDSRAPQYGAADVGSQQRARARLGISMEQADEGIRIQQVMRGTAAAQAGLRPGDVIVSVNGQAIADPNQLSTMIRQRQPGDRVDMVVMRDGQQQSLNATLTGFDAGDRQRMARPNLDADENQDLRQQVQQLQEEVRSLRNELNQMRDGQGANAQRTEARSGAEADAQADPNATRPQTDLDLDAQSDIPDAPAPRSGAEADLDLDTDTEADADLNLDTDTDADVDLGADVEADNPLE